MKLFWLSFADPELPEGEQFLGVAIVGVTEQAIDFIDHMDPTDGIELLRERGQEVDVPFYAAVQWASLLGINPGGEVVGYDVSDNSDKIPDSLRHKLLSKDDLKNAGLI